MSTQPGLRERKKAQQREHIADVAAELFATPGYDAVSMVDVARAADVSDQTIYKCFPTKPELVFDRADEFRELYARAIRERTAPRTPADAIRPLVTTDIERYRDDDPKLARGEFPALCLQSGGLRRFALELREQQTGRIAAAIVETEAGIPAIVARTHAAALVSVIQLVTDQIGAHILANTPVETAVAEITAAANIAFGLESDYVTHLGYYYVLADLDADDDNMLYNEPGRMVGLDGSKAQVVDAYAGGRWWLPELMAKISAASEFHMDSISRVTMDHYSRGPRSRRSLTGVRAAPESASPGRRL